ncbi:HEAT repeat domain-containing protein [Leptothoe sp. PORK10 BA2]|uniref:HEAT repeat domain-containing protein n=1 Tax=Leptothoe sp. PORK10 BA2 TaxID=3110254 RepID=UPI002B212442|nr:HEAT repeat domain-containing protein [Leptothoe sp. PORK10 BA2]MEA5463699.1 HEAT repeat domain-containing protein [Leptothoe sp. PORK10 BA2]
MQSAPSHSPPPWLQKIFTVLNLRPEEGHRTLLLFAFYTLMSMGIMWLEVSSAALFLEQYGANKLPLIYLFSAVVGVSLGSIYSWLQRLMPLRQVIVLIALLITLPISLFRIGLDVVVWAPMTIFAMRLWMESITNLNELNLAVLANQLFNIREIKRTFPLISSGNLVADTLSGFTLFAVLGFLDIKNVIYLVLGIMLVATGVLFYISNTYQHAFPDSKRRIVEVSNVNFAARRLRKLIRRYVLLLVSFFVIAQMLLYLVEYQYLNQLTVQNFSVDTMAKFLGIFTGVLGLAELVTQLFTSSRLIERWGLFLTTGFLPAVVAVLSCLCLVVSLPALGGSKWLFIGLVILKFIDEWLRYTIVVSSRPVLFQPIPAQRRARVQSLVGVSEAVAIGLVGVGIWVILALVQHISWMQGDTLFLLITLGLSLLWLGSIFLLRSQYLNLLVLTAERGLLNFTDANLRVLKQAIIEALDKPGPEADKRSLIELLTQIEPRSISEVLAPMLSDLSPGLQQQSLETMLVYPDPTFTGYVDALIYPAQEPQILALAVRYVWLTQTDADVNQLKPYLQPTVDPVVRGTASSMLLKRGSTIERARATYILKQMLTHQEERERVMGCRALGEADYMQGLRLHVDNLLQDDSLRVRRSMLEAIAATRLEKYYPNLLQALIYKNTRKAAIQALVDLGDDVLPMLTQLANNRYQSDALRQQAWNVIGQIGTLRAMNLLASNLLTSWGEPRRWLLRILVKLSDEEGLRRSSDIEIAPDQLGRQGVEKLLNQELQFIGQLCSGLVDCSADKATGETFDLLRRSLQDMKTDAMERMFLLMRLLYTSSTIQAAELSLDGSASSRARGLEILDNTLDIPAKRAVLTLFEQSSEEATIAAVGPLVSYTPLSPQERLRNLIELRHFLSAWGLACCFHVATAEKWSIRSDHVRASLNHPMGFVREAVLSYLDMASPRTLKYLLPKMVNDPNRLVAEQVQKMLKKYGGHGAVGLKT